MTKETKTSRSEPSAIALIPARAGSRRVPDKNIRLLAGHPVIAYTIAAARQSNVFSAVVVSTDSVEYAEIARRYGAEVPFLRPAEMARSDSPDIEWVRYTLGKLRENGRAYDCFSILRPTSPFRRPETIRKAWQLFLATAGVDSLRAVEPVVQHPGKMWMIRGARMYPLLPFTRTCEVGKTGKCEQPWHSCQTNTLPEVYVQNASLEIAWCRVALEGNTIAGEAVVPFVSEGHDGFDINQMEDWRQAETLVASAQVALPEVVASEPYKKGISQW